MEGTPLTGSKKHKQPTRLLTHKELDKCFAKMRRANRGDKVNYFYRTKQDRRATQDTNSLYKHRIYFDCETFELHTDPSNPDELPTIVPYLIGWCYEQPGTYQYTIGINAGSDFLSKAFKSPSAKKGFLTAFNVDYDFQVLRPIIIDTFGKDIKILYQMTETKKFIYGELKGKGIDLRIRDLWRWDTSNSLSRYMDHIVSMAFNSDGSIKQDKICDWATGSYCYELGNELLRWGLDPASFKKLSIDYRKINVHEGSDGCLYYWRSREDWIAQLPPTKLDIESELKYLRNDVLALPIVEKDQLLFKKYAKQLLRIDNPHDTDYSITLPGFAKYLCEEYTHEYFTESVRRKVLVEDYRHECRSYIGAFTGGNSEITYIDEQTFKEAFPGHSFYDNNGEPVIKSYDVNSMYPWAMRTGLPYGALYYVKPKGKCVEWVEIHFTKWWDKENTDKAKRLYQWKPKYAYLNNSFFGDNFIFGLTPGLESQNRVYVLRETLDLFYEMCDAHVVEICSRWQKKYTKLDPFIDMLYSIKANKDKK